MKTELTEQYRPKTGYGKFGTVLLKVICTRLSGEYGTYCYLWDLESGISGNSELTVLQLRQWGHIQRLLLEEQLLCAQLALAHFGWRCVLVTLLLSINLA